MANIITTPEELFSAKNIAILLKRLDPDLAANIVFSGVSLNSQKVIEVIQACLIVSSQREVDAKAKIQQKAEEIVERVMSQFDAQQAKTDAPPTTSTENK